MRKEEEDGARAEERKKEKEMVEKRNFWLTYFTCQGGAGMWIHVVRAHRNTYLYDMGTYVTVCIYSTPSVYVCVV